ncbi:hypothetical protein TanjilG_11242 [Lupinus angustifolius]|uniref:Uncharacterized protein n=1 Tax=Lupinus angustifolius TaxID=3871 RepID=A0A1J7GPJ9_LUPAN|nr:PREDICTED: uncharacterized protein LOC109361212 [Lupinus angustifolius]OIW02348.1 hypothetical protein TanjilG_11242 [Lupinus angustifolius]
MEVPLIDRLNDLQLGLNSLHNPSQIISPLSNSIAYNLCKWGAVILALVATFGTFINKVTIFIIRFRNKAATSLPSIPYLDDYEDSDDDDDYDFSNDDDDATSSEFEEDEENDESSASASSPGFYFTVSGSDDDEFQNESGTHKRRRNIGDIFSFSEIANSKSVVKLWDSIGFGLGLDFDDYEEPVTQRCKSPAILTSSPSVVLSAGEGACGNLAVEVWDTRLRCRKPSVVAEWGTNIGKTVRVESGGVQKVYVRDNGRYSVMVGDMRNVRTPLGNVTESDADIWWDADANESYGEEQSLLHPT